MKFAREEAMGEPEAGGEKRRMRSKAERRRIVEETLEPGASVARVARAHGVNANQVFKWRTLYREGRLGGACQESCV
jgi:transposase